MSIFQKLKMMFGGSTPSTNGAGGEEAANDHGGEMLSCSEALRLVHDYLDGELPTAPASEVKKHFEMCAACYPHLRLEEAYRETVNRVAGHVTPPADLRERVAVLLQQEAREE